MELYPHSKQTTCSSDNTDLNCLNKKCSKNAWINCQQKCKLKLECNTDIINSLDWHQMKVLKCQTSVSHHAQYLTTAQHLSTAEPAMNGLKAEHLSFNITCNYFESVSFRGSSHYCLPDGTFRQIYERALLCKVLCDKSYYGYCTMPVTYWYFHYQIQNTCVTIPMPGLLLVIAAFMS